MQKYYWGMLAIPIIFALIFNYVPMFGLIMSFEEYYPSKGFLGSEWVGLKHFKTMFTIPEVSRVFRNTLVISIGKLALELVVSLLFAILLNEIRIKSLKKTCQTLVYLPYFISWVILGIVVRNILGYDGLINVFLRSNGMEEIGFLTSNKYFQGTLIVTDVWKNFGYRAIIYMAALTNVDPGLHEAAAIDGAPWWRRVWHVTLPCMLPMIMVGMAMGISGVLSAGFDQVVNLYNAVVYETGDILDTYVYRVGLLGRKYSFGAAVGFLKSVVGLILMLSANQFSKKTCGNKIF